MHPELIRTIILEDGNIDSILPETPEKQQRTADFKERSETARKNLEAGNPEKAAREWWDNYVGPGTWEKFPNTLKATIIDNVWSAIDSGERGSVSCDDVLGFNFPTLLLNGEKRFINYFNIFRELRKCSANIPEPIVVPHATHIIHATNPEFYNSAVLDSLHKH